MEYLIKAYITIKIVYIGFYRILSYSLEIEIQSVHRFMVAIRGNIATELVKEEFL
jgi:hypothetical protein